MWRGGGLSTSNLKITQDRNKTILLDYFVQLVGSGRGAAAQAAPAGEKAAWGLRAEKEKTFAIYRFVN